jgi:hypothetical protein
MPICQYYCHHCYGYYYMISSKYIYTKYYLHLQKKSYYIFLNGKETPFTATPYHGVMLGWQAVRT